MATETSQLLAVGVDVMMGRTYTIQFVMTGDDALVIPR